MSLKQNIHDDLKDAMKAKNELTILVLRSLIAEINLKEIELKKKEEGLSDIEVEQVVLREIKKCHDAIEQYKNGNRNDLVEKEEQEVQILNKFAPEMIDETELKVLVDGIINELGAETINDMGRVMSAVMQKVGNKANGSLVNRLVREKLDS